ncbi:hypothetical protein EVA_04663, partial [gut metagenome]
HGTEIVFSRDVPTPVRDGYQFNGWVTYDDSPLTGTRLTTDETITASWVPNPYRVGGGD